MRSSHWLIPELSTYLYDQTVNGRQLQLAHVSGLAVFCAGDDIRLLFAAARDDDVARAALLTILNN